MKKLVLAIVFFILSVECKAQDNNLSYLPNYSLDSTKPQTKIIVNKEYDENGNLISFDSTYSYFYSNIQQDSLLGDSTFAQFKTDFCNSYLGNQKPLLNDLFFEDSLLYYDFL